MSAGASLSALYRNSPQIPRIALPAALASLVGAGALAHHGWVEAQRLGPLFLEVPWRYALVSVGLVVLALLLGLGGVSALRSRGAAAEPQAGELKTAGWLAPLMLSLGCVVVLATFRALDLWHAAFDDHSWRYPVYAAARLAFMGYLAIALAGSGTWVLAVVERRGGSMMLGPVERAVAAFFMGAAAWGVALFAMGLAGALRLMLVAPLFVLGVWSSWPLLQRAWRHAGNWAGRGLRRSTPAGLALIALPLGALMVAWGHVLVNRGLAVTGFDYDSSGHYLPYFEAVVAEGGTGVNELWYHFWISKGAGLHFVATMLTDIEGPQLVSFTFLTMAVAAIALLVRRVSRSAALGIVAATFLLSPFTHSFASYQKQHVLTVAFVSAMLWLVTLSWFDQPRARKSALACAAVLTLATVLHAPPLAAVIGPFLAFMALAAAMTGHATGDREKWASVLPLVAALAGTTSVLLINYAMTGLMEVTPFRLFWDVADQSVFATHVSPYLMLLMDEGTGRATGHVGWSGVLNPQRIHDLLHVQYLPDGVARGAAGLLVCLLLASAFERRLRRIFLGTVVPITLFAASAAALAVVVQQPGSIDRFYVFSLVPIACLAASGPAVLMRRLQESQPAAGMAQWAKAAVMFLLPATMAIVSVLGTAKWINGFFNGETAAPFLARLDFALGRTSFREALLASYQPRDPAAWPRREVSDTCLGMRAAVHDRGGADGLHGAVPRIWTMTFLREAGCHILPDVRIMLENSNRFGEHWHRIVFGEPSLAERELARIGVRYVFVDLGRFEPEKKRGGSTSLFGCLAYSPLMSPESLPSRFRVAWNEGDSYLLVLASAGTGQPLPEGFARQFADKRSAIQPGLGDMRGMCARLGGYFERYGETWPVHADRTLPRLEGWQ